jgi:hypothetical protein
LIVDGIFDGLIGLNGDLKLKIKVLISGVSEHDKIVEIEDIICKGVVDL